MDKATVRYIVDGDGKKAAVVLPVEDFERLVEHLEDLEDGLALDQAESSKRDFIPYETIRSELKKEGRLCTKS